MSHDKTYTVAETGNSVQFFPHIGDRFENVSMQSLYKLNGAGLGC